MPTPRAGYRNAAGEKVPSVTTILSRFKDSGGLIKWAYRQGREHEGLALRGEYQKRLGALCAQDAGPQHLGIEIAAGALLGGNWREPLPPAPADLYDNVGKAAEAGTIAHDLIERHVLAKLPSGESITTLPESAQGADDETVARALNSYAQFRRWLASTRVEVIATEQGLVSELHQYGGTLDGVGRDGDGAIVLIDWKTSNGVFAEFLFQLAAYALLLEERRPEWAPTGFHLLRVAKETGDFGHHFYDQLDLQKRGFLLMRELYGIASTTAKRAK